MRESATHAVGQIGEELGEARQRGRRGRCPRVVLEPGKEPAIVDGQPAKAPRLGFIGGTPACTGDAQTVFERKGLGSVHAAPYHGYFHA